MVRFLKNLKPAEAALAWSVLYLFIAIFASAPVASAFFFTISFLMLFIHEMVGGKMKFWWLTRPTSLALTAVFAVRAFQLLTAL